MSFFPLISYILSKCLLVIKVVFAIINGEGYENMQIKLDNVGIVKNSSIDIDGLTVITGANNSGKSTVGKAAYALVRSVENYEFKAMIDRFDYAVTHLKEIPNFFPLMVKSALKSFASTADMTLRAVFVDSKLFNDVEVSEIDNFLSSFKKALVQVDFNNVKEKETFFWGFMDDPTYSSEKFEMDKGKSIAYVDEIIQKINDDPELENYIKEAVRSQLDVEFSGQVAPVKEPSSKVSIEITSGGQRCMYVVLQDGGYPEGFRKVLDRKPYSNVFYIDDPFVVEDDYQFSKFALSAQHKESFINSNIILRHRDDLRFRLKNMQELNVWEKVQAMAKFKQISNRMNAVLPGTFVSENKTKFYKGTDGAKLDISNLATGAKMFSILKMLIMSGDLSERSLLILDEPECHLHPDWQNKFAEMVVLLVKEIGCHVLLTTHSQNFLLALDAMTRQYDIKNRTNFYQAIKSDNSFVNYVDVSQDLKPIYADFVKGFSEMKNLYDNIVGM